MSSTLPFYAVWTVHSLPILFPKYKQIILNVLQIFNFSCCRTCGEFYKIRKMSCINDSNIWFAEMSNSIGHTVKLFVHYYAFKSARHPHILMLRTLRTHKIISKVYFERYGQHKGVVIQGAYKLSEDFAFTFTNKTGSHHTGIRRSGST